MVKKGIGSLTPRVYPHGEHPNPRARPVVGAGPLRVPGNQGRMGTTAANAADTPEPGSKSGAWAALVVVGSAGAFFAACPDDAGLADLLNRLLPGSGTISEEQVRRDRGRCGAGHSPSPNGAAASEAGDAEPAASDVSAATAEIAGTLRLLG